MGQSRMFRDDEPRDGEVSSPRTTIVGGRPPEDGAIAPAVPTGMQTLLRLAAVDPTFRAEFVQRRGAIAEAAGVSLSASEARVLAAIPAAQLVAMIDNLPPPSSARRDFLRQSAATAVVLLGGAVLEGTLPGCTRKAPDPGPPQVSPPPTDPQNTAGPFAQPPPEDQPPPRPDHNPMQTEGGAAPDPPPPRPDHHHMAPGGVRPDLEPEPSTPSDPQPTRGIRPDIPPKPPTDGEQ